MVFGVCESVSLKYKSFVRVKDQYLISGKEYDIYIYVYKC